MRTPSILICLLLGGPAALLPAVDTDLLALAPPETKFIAGIDVARTRSSTFGQYLMTRMTADDTSLQQLAQETGFDPRHDLDEILIATPAAPGASEGSKSNSFTILARGNFDQAKIRAAAQKSGAVNRRYQGVDLLLPNGPKDNQIAIAFLQSGLALMGDLRSVQKIIDNRATPSVLDHDLQARVDQASKDDAWFASIGGGPAFFPPQLQGGGNTDEQQAKQAQVLQSIIRSSGGIQLGDVVEMHFDAVTRSAKDATSLADVVRFFSSMVQMQRDKDPRAALLASAIDNMSVKVSGSGVDVKLAVPEKDIEQLAQLGEPHRTRNRR